MKKIEGSCVLVFCAQFCCKFYLMFFLFFSVFLLFQDVLCKSPLSSAIVVDTNTREVLYSSNANGTTQPASLAKVMSFYIAFKALKAGKIKFEDQIKISSKAANQEPCKLGLKAGTTITVRNAILGMLTKSANDASVALAEHIAGTEATFVKMMNSEAKRLRMRSTIFCNPSGWKNNKQQTSARDLAKLSIAVMKDFPQYYYLFSTRTFRYKGKSYKNHNSMLGEKGDIKIDGLKTGFVCASGYNIAVSAKKGTDRLLIVVCGGKSPEKRNKQVEWLLSSAFNKLAKRKSIDNNIKTIKKRKAIYTCFFNQQDFAKLKKGNVISTKTMEKSCFERN